MYHNSNNPSGSSWGQGGGYQGYNPTIPDNNYNNQMNMNYGNNNMSNNSNMHSSYNNNNNNNSYMDNNGMENVPQQYPNMQQNNDSISSQKMGGEMGGPSLMTSTNTNNPNSPWMNMETLDSLSQNNHMVNAGLSLGKDYLETNVKKYIPLVSSNWLVMKYYFSVNNEYVLKKISILLAPWIQKKWKRSLDPNGDGHAADGAGTKYAKALDDPNAPDLYIPIMAFISYALVVGYVKGGVGEFTPETIVQVISTCLVTQILEVMLMTLGLYLMRCNASIGDLFSYTGYKYVPLSLHMIIAFIIGGGWINTLVFVYFAIATAYFMIKTLAHGINTTHSTGAAALPKEAVVIGSGVLQVITMWYLSYSDAAPQ